MNEIWKDIKGFVGYQVSNLGRVKSFRQNKNGRILKGSINSDGYIKVVLLSESGKKTFSIHRLVMETFCPVENMKDLTVDHINSNKLENTLDNLQWLSRQDNVKKEQSIKVLCVETDTIYNSASEAARQTGIAQTNISACCNGKRKTAGGFHWKFAEVN